MALSSYLPTDKTRPDQFEPEPVLVFDHLAFPCNACVHRERPEAECAGCAHYSKP